MSALLFVLAGTLSLLLHLALGLAVAPALLGGPDALRPGPGLVSRARVPWQTLLSLLRREPVRTTTVPLLHAVPALALALTLCAFALIPSFATAMRTAPVAELWSAAGLLALARLVVLVADCDGGLAASGLEAMRGLTALLLSLPGGVLCLSAFSGQGGAPLGQALAAPSAQTCLAAIGLGLAALSAGGADASSPHQSGPGLALLRLARGLACLAWIDLVSGLLLPGTLASSGSAPWHWLGGMLLWAVRLLLGWWLVALAGRVCRTSLARRRLAGLSVLLGLLSPLLALAARATP